LLAARGGVLRLPVERGLGRLLLLRLDRADLLDDRGLAAGREVVRVDDLDAVRRLGREALRELVRDTLAVRVGRTVVGHGALDRLEGELLEFEAIDDFLANGEEGHLLAFGLELVPAPPREAEHVAVVAAAEAAVRADDEEGHLLDRLALREERVERPRLLAAARLAR